MTAHKDQHYNMSLDEFRVDTNPRDERRAGVPALVPVSPCVSEDSGSTAAAPSVTGSVGDIRRRYRVDPRVLGTGHSGSVRRCTDRATGRRLAVKTILKSDRKVILSSLAREISLLEEVKHPNIVRLVEVCEDHNYLNIVTDLCSGGELFDKIIEKSCNRNNGAACFAEDEAARILRHILSAVSYMHERGIVHRDIKPENILFEYAGEDSPVKIIDFGLARKHRGRLEPPMSTIVGTPCYIAPEVLKKKYDKSCDLWSVGVVTHTMLCGYPPFNGADNRKVNDAVRRGRYSFPSSGVSKDARDFICGLLQRNPRKRMTIEQALNHPWIARHVQHSVSTSDEGREDNSSVEVVFNGSLIDSIIYDGTETRDVRMHDVFANV